MSNVGASRVFLDSGFVFGQGVALPIPSESARRRPRIAQPWERNAGAAANPSGVCEEPARPVSAATDDQRCRRSADVRGDWGGDAQSRPQSSGA